jgi:hypothetical protein
LVGKPEESEPLERHTSKCEDSRNRRRDINWIKLAQDRDN